MGYLHHGNYFQLFEIARTDLLKENGVSYRDLERAGVYFVVYKLACKYLRPIRYDDLLDIAVRVTRITRTRVDHEYQVHVNGELTTEATSTLACIGREGAPTVMPDSLWGGA